MTANALEYLKEWEGKISKPEKWLCCHSVTVSTKYVFTSEKTFEMCFTGEKKNYPFILISCTLTA